MAARLVEASRSIIYRFDDSVTLILRDMGTFDVAVRGLGGWNELELGVSIKDPNYFDDLQAA